MPNAATDTSQLHGRRAVGFLVLSTFLPGSVQRMAGNARVGTIALRVWFAVIGLFVLLALGGLFLPGPTVAFLLTPWVAATMKVVVWVLFVGWLLLLLDSWRLARPMRMPQKMRLFMTIAVGVLAITLGFTTNYVASAFTAAGNVGEALPGGGDVEQKSGRYNVLLLGLDSADGRIGIRPDSINVASIDADTGRTVLFGLPRNMQRVPFAEGSPMRKVYPDGFHCDDNECMLNAVWTAGEENAELFDEGVDAGLQATKDAVSGALGLELNYYAMVDMKGFESIIDAMGGIKLDVMKRIPIGGGGSPVSGYIEPGRGVHLDGRHALWFARSRHGSSDYERMQRQKCVMAAMAHQLDPQLVATRFVELSEAGKNLLRTDVGRDQIVDLVNLALKARNSQMSSVNFMPPLIPNTANPDFGLIHKTVQRTIEQSEAAGAGAPAPSEQPTSEPTSDEPAGTQTPEAPSPSTTPDEADEQPTAEDTLEANPDAYTDETESDDLTAVCAASK